MPRSSITVSHRLDNGQNTASAAQELLGEDAQADVQIFVSPKSASELSAPPARGRPKEPSPPQSVTSIWSSKSTTKRQPVLVGENLDWAKQRLLDGLAHSRIKDVRQAIADGVDVNFRDAKGDTPLHHAARNGKLTMAQLLLDLGGVRVPPCLRKPCPLYRCLRVSHPRLTLLTARHTRDRRCVSSINA